MCEFHDSDFHSTMKGIIQRYAHYPLLHHLPPSGPYISRASQVVREILVPDTLRRR